MKEIKHGDTAIDINTGIIYRYMEHPPKWWEEKEKKRLQEAIEQDKPAHPNCYTPCGYTPVYGKEGKRFIKFLNQQSKKI